jgi:hypothetical protein
MCPHSVLFGTCTSHVRVDVVTVLVLHRCCRIVALASSEPRPSKCTLYLLTLFVRRHDCVFCFVGDLAHIQLKSAAPVCWPCLSVVCSVRAQKPAGQSTQRQQLSLGVTVAAAAGGDSSKGSVSSNASLARSDHNGAAPGGAPAWPMEPTGFSPEGLGQAPLQSASAGNNLAGGGPVGSHPGGAHHATGTPAHAALGPSPVQHYAAGPPRLSGLGGPQHGAMSAPPHAVASPRTSYAAPGPALHAAQVSSMAPTTQQPPGPTSALLPPGTAPMPQARGAGHGVPHPALVQPTPDGMHFSALSAAAPWAVTAHPPQDHKPVSAMHTRLGACDVHPYQNGPVEGNGALAGAPTAAPRGQIGVLWTSGQQQGGVSDVMSEVPL